ncbi:MAG: methyltransferase domain-containing protein [Alphaproteobacteria bacterium]|nr:methyltransferase domain-containing protein [Alphaproteobacteria bacterium]
MLIFDRSLAEKRRLKTAGQLDRYNYLYKYAEENLIQNLSFIKKSFEKVLILGGCTKGLSQSLQNLCPSTNLSVYSNFWDQDVTLEKSLYVNADEECLPFREQSFDLIIMPHSLHKMNDIPGILAQIQKILKPDGLFLASFFGGKTLTELRQILFEVEVSQRDGSSPRVSPFIELSTAASLLERSGFSLPVVDRDTLKVTFSDLYQLMYDLKGMGETNTLIQREKRFTPRSLFTEAAKRYKEKFSSSPERIFATFEIFYLTGWIPHPSQQKPLIPGSAKYHLADILKI